MPGFVEDISDLNFEAEVLGSSEPFLLDFSATWCAPCKALDPILQTLAEEQRGQLRIGKVDIDSSPGVATRLGVRGAPTLVLFHAGQERARRLGFTSRAGLVSLLGLPLPAAR